MLSLAFALLQDSSQQQMDANTAAGIGIVALLFCILFGIAILACLIFLFWRIFTKAGLSGALGFIALLGPIGIFVNLCILAFMPWKVTPVTHAPALPTAYQPPPSYPPASFPPSQPPTT